MRDYGPKMRDAKFIYQPEKKKVICVLEDTQRDCTKFFLNEFDHGEDIWTVFYSGHYAKDLLMPNRFVGIATCADEDEYDEQTGRLLAYQRARLKYDTSFIKTSQRFLDKRDEELNNIFEKINRFGEVMGNNMAHREELLQKRMGV